MAGLRLHYHQELDLQPHTFWGSACLFAFSCTQCNYSPIVGRFLSPDTIVPDLRNPQSLNRYSYVYNRPLNLVDSTGHWGEDPNDKGNRRNPCQLLPGGCSSSPPLENGDDLNVQQSTTVPLGDGGGVMAQGKGIGQRVKDTGKAALAWLLAKLGLTPPDTWSQDKFQRGREIEDRLGQNLPEGFPTIDRFANGVATSIKSINLADKTYQRVSALASKVKGYVNDVSGFVGESYGGVRIDASMITSRELVIAIPSGATQQQLQALAQVQQWAANLPVPVVVKIVTVK